MSEQYQYRHGGNPPVAAGLFVKETGHAWKRLAFWPVTVAPTPENFERVMLELVWKREDDKPVGRDAVAKLFET